MERIRERGIDREQIAKLSAAGCPGSGEQGGGE
jgi:hypothetical protein